MARTIADLDPRDYAARDQVRRQLVDLRAQQHVTQQTLGDRMGRDQASIRRLERQGVLQSRTSTVVRWARGLVHELVLEPVDFPDPVKVRRPSRSRNADEILAMLVHTSKLAGDDWAAARLVSDLVGIRVAAGVHQDRLADRLGVTVQAVSYFESVTADSALALLQRYARGIALCSRWRNGRLDVRLEPIVAEPQLTGDSRSVDTGELVPSS